MRQRNETLWGKDSMEFNPEREWKGKQIESEWSEHNGSTVVSISITSFFKLVSLSMSHSLLF